MNMYKHHHLWATLECNSIVEVEYKLMQYKKDYKQSKLNINIQNII